MAEKNLIEIVVAGHKLSLRSDVGQEQAEAAAQLVNQKLRDIGAPMSTMTNRHYLLLSMVLASEILEKDKRISELQLAALDKEKELSQFRTNVRERTQKVLSKLENQFQLDL